ncbi:hypothetical protein C2G38_2156849 [Gigaspora rosea]|uniref:Uncharacterized protein n=1 Tax=Gigaspora rosea TaxID=44941 RepID=A0A397W916_9GLOM|nr:hypothetical protein C2G38_2156849 [Gigaspora rosea]
MENLSKLIKAIRKNSTLTSLNLSLNNLGSEECGLEAEGGKAFANALCKCTTLTSLELSFNNLENHWQMPFCKSVTLTSLTLWDNNLEREGGIKEKHWQMHSQEHYAATNYNNLESGGGKALANALCNSITLTSLIFFE